MGWRDAETSLDAVKAHLKAFNEARDWGQFHRPKDLAMALSCEAGELLEVFLWKGETEDVDLRAAREELADVLICALNLAARLDIDLLAAVELKVARNAQRYPVEVARGRATKYDRLPGQKFVEDHDGA